MVITHLLIVDHLTTAIKLPQLVPTLHRLIPPAPLPILANSLISPNKPLPRRIHLPKQGKPVHKLDNKVNSSGKIYNRQEGIYDCIKYIYDDLLLRIDLI